MVLGHSFEVDSWHFRSEKGYLRHPELVRIWDESDFSNDQLVPLLMAQHLGSQFVLREFRLRIRGTNTIMTPASLALYHGLIRTFGVASVAQAVILRLIPFRWNENKGFQWSSDYGADYLNLISSVAFLRRMGHGFLAWLILAIAGRSRSFKAIYKHYSNEPKSTLRDIVLEMYREAIYKGEK